FYAIDSWDGSGAGGPGPDYFDVSADGARLFHETFENYSAADPQSYRNGTGAVALQVVPTLTGLGGRPGVDGTFDLLGSGFMAGATAVTVGGVAGSDPLAEPNSGYGYSGGVVTGAANGDDRLALPGAVEGSITVTTAGGS